MSSLSEDVNPKSIYGIERDTRAGLERRATDLLELYGLSEREAMVFVHILRNGSSSAGEIARTLRLGRVEAYKLVKKLTESNLIHASAGKPVTYSVQSLESFIGSMTDIQMQTLKGMEVARGELIYLTRNLHRTDSRASNQRFKMIQGREQIYNHLARMVRASTRSVDLIFTRNDLVLSNIVGLTDGLNQVAERGSRVRIISQVDESTMEAAEGLSGRCQLRHSSVTSVGRLGVADSSQTLTSLVLDSSQGMKNDKDVAIWSDSRDYATLMSSLFETAYNASSPAEGRIRVARRAKEASG